MRRLRSQNRVAGHLDAAVRAVFEAHRAAQAAGELAVALALGGARANGAPAHQVADELRAEQVQKLGAHGQAQAHDVEQQRARQCQAFVDRKTAVQVRVVDVALPAHGGARLLEIGAHHDEQLALQRVGLGLEPVRVFHGLAVVVNRARAHHHDQAVVAPVQHLANGGAAALHRGQHRLGGGQLLLQEHGRDQGAHGANAGVVGADLVGGVGHGVGAGQIK